MNNHPFALRRSRTNDRPCLTLWRRHERTFDAGARAYQTASGYWIVSRNHQCCDVAASENDARTMLLDYARQLSA